MDQVRSKWMQIYAFESSKTWLVNNNFYELCFEQLKYHDFDNFESW